jgi:hypothetical protein
LRTVLYELEERRRVEARAGHARSRSANTTHTLAYFTH